ncbi:MAG TPA: hypothetical protein VK633_10185, partial [Verrucomicrobiae bacterium]|nr:hypothetical protein [Verrucomicrobiae bacterium]
MERKRANRLTNKWALLCGLLGVLGAGCAGQKQSAGGLSPLGYSSGYPLHAGEYGADLNVLRTFLTGPTAVGE